MIHENITVYQNVTLGNNNGFPTIKDNVTLFANYVIAGKRVIGKNSIIDNGPKWLLTK